MRQRASMRRRSPPIAPAPAIARRTSPARKPDEASAKRQLAVDLPAPLGRAGDDVAARHRQRDMRHGAAPPA